jgi:hypothetical protein
MLALFASLQGQERCSCCPEKDIYVSHAVGMDAERVSSRLYRCYNFCAKEDASVENFYWVSKLLQKLDCDESKLSAQYMRSTSVLHTNTDNNRLTQTTTDTLTRSFSLRFSLPLEWPVNEKPEDHLKLQTFLQQLSQNELLRVRALVSEVLTHSYTVHSFISRNWKRANSPFASRHLKNKNLYAFVY